MVNDITRTLNMWTEKRRIVLLEEDDIPHRKYFYISTEIGDVFQVVIEPENNGRIRLDLHLIESFDDSDISFYIESEARNFESFLDVLEKLIVSWGNIVRTKV